MASEAPVLRDDHGRRIHVGHTQDGAFCVSITDGLTSVMAVLSGERLAAFTEAVDRAAMPGQPAPQPDEPTQEEIDRCADSEDAYHRCRVCYDYAVGRDR